MKFNCTLPPFFNKNLLNSAIQLAENNVQKIDLNDIESDYSSNYDSEESNKSFDKEECEKYDSGTDSNVYRPDNFSYYLKSIGAERHRQRNIAFEELYRKKILSKTSSIMEYFLTWFAIRRLW